MNYSKLNTKTFICEAKNYFGTTDYELKVQYNNHKKLFAHCIDEKATELSNTFGVAKWSIANGS